MAESRAILDRDELIVYLTHTQHRWEKHGEEDVLAIDVQCKLTNQDDWVPVLCDLLGWTEKQVTAFCTLTAEAYGKKEFPWDGGFERHQVKFMGVIGGVNRTLYATIWEGKINKFVSAFKDAEMSFRIQGTIESEDVAAQFIELERDTIALRISPLQMPEANKQEESPQQSMPMGESEGDADAQTSIEDAQAESPEPEEPAGEDEEEQP